MVSVGDLEFGQGARELASTPSVQSMYGGAGQTERALRIRGWIVVGDGGEALLTEAGRERAADLVPPQV